MVYKTDIKALDFETIEDYFNYVVSSIINGQMKQARNLVWAMSKQQKKDFYNHCDVSDKTSRRHSELATAKALVIELI